jgi:hypothetical protein
VLSGDAAGLLKLHLQAGDLLTEAGDDGILLTAALSCCGELGFQRAYRRGVDTLTEIPLSLGAGLAHLPSVTARLLTAMRGN